MQYINPYELFGIADLNDLTQEKISRAKRKLLIEFDLTQESTIQYHDIPFTKNYIIRLAESFENNANYEFHTYILTNKPLLQFLTEGDITFFTNFEEQEKYKDADFIEFIAPFYVEKFNHFFLNDFVASKTNLARKILNKNILLKTRFENDCYEFVRQFTSKMLSHIAELENETEKYTKEYYNRCYEIQNVLHIGILNLLPEKYQYYRNNVAMEVLKLYNSLNENPLKEFLLFSILKKIETTGEVDLKIRLLYFQTYEPRAITPDNEEDSGYAVKIALFVFFIILASIFSSKKNSNNNLEKYNLYNKYLYDNQIAHQNKSLRAESS